LDFKRRPLNGTNLGWLLKILQFSASFWHFGEGRLQTKILNSLILLGVLKIPVNQNLLPCRRLKNFGGLLL